MNKSKDPNEKVDFICARPIRSIDQTWLVESEEYITYISSFQISALLPKKAPFITGGYWDDIAFAGAMVKGPNKFLVLGAGIGSFLPLLDVVNPNISVNCVEINQEISEIGEKAQKEICPKLFEKTLWHNVPAENLDDEVLKGTEIVFIDIYTKDGLSEIALDEKIHEKIKKYLMPQGVVFLNVFDQLWDKVENSPTSFFINKLTKIYPTVGFFRRSASSTIVCSLEDKETLKNHIVSTSNDLPANLISYYDKLIATILFLDDKKSQVEEFDLNLLKFGKQIDELSFRVSIGSDEIENNMTERALKDISSLSNLDIIKLSRKKGGIIGC